MQYEAEFIVTDATGREDARVQQLWAASPEFAAEKLRKQYDPAKVEMIGLKVIGQ